MRLIDVASYFRHSLRRGVHRRDHQAAAAQPVPRYPRATRSHPPAGKWRVDKRVAAQVAERVKSAGGGFGGGGLLRQGAPTRAAASAPGPARWGLMDSARLVKGCH